MSAHKRLLVFYEFDAVVQVLDTLSYLQTDQNSWGVCAVSAAGVRRLHRSNRPDDHFTASPHCRVRIRAAGALVVLVAVQLSVPGLYLPPVFKSLRSISAPDDHFTASPHCRVTTRPVGALVVLVAVQLSVPGLYLPPVFKSLTTITPPQTIISLPVHTAV